MDESSGVFKFNKVPAVEKIKPFKVPKFVRSDERAYKIEEVPRDVLEAMCDQFKEDVLDKLEGNHDPDEET